MKTALVRLLAATAMLLFTGARAPAAALHPGASPQGKIVLLMVWDGLRPDLVDRERTPNLYALEEEGVRFAHHHSVYPTLTMVDAAALATGGAPVPAGIFGDMMYLPPILEMARASAIPVIGALLSSPLNLENSKFLAALDGPAAFDGHLLGLESVGRQVADAGGYVAIVGKQGPTLLFDDGLLAPDGSPGAPANPNYLFVADDAAAPREVDAAFAQMPKMTRGDQASVIERDAWFARLVIDRALPAAKGAAAAGKPALVVFWQHNPDLTQHHAGLGTQPALDALTACDRNLAAIRSALTALGIAESTDLMIVSDHGFATIKADVPLASLLVAAGLKHDKDSTDVIVTSDGGSDSITLSRAEFRTGAARKAMLQRIVDFALEQEWSGPIFSPAARSNGSATSNDRALAQVRKSYAGWIGGTFSQSAFGLGDSPRSPDLLISFRELSDIDNRGLTGPGNPAIAIGPHGNEPRENHSAPLVQPVAGLMYSDAPKFTTGMGMHGAAAMRELHNVCAAAGPDFRHAFVDDAPTSNTDVAATVQQILGQRPAAGAGARVMREALRRGASSSSAHWQPASTSVTRTLDGQRITATLFLTRYDGREYLDDARVARAPAK